MTFAIVKVLPEPVTPKSVWYLLPDLTDATILATARAWSSLGLNLDEISKFFIFYLKNQLFLLQLHKIIPKLRKKMFDNDKVLNTLTDKVNDLLARYNEICEENESLRNELISVKAQNEAKTNQIARLEEDLRTKNTESDDVIRKIEAVLGK